MIGDGWQAGAGPIAGTSLMAGRKAGKSGMAGKSWMAGRNWMVGRSSITGRTLISSWGLDSKLESQCVFRAPCSLPPYRNTCNALPDLHTSTSLHLSPSLATPSAIRIPVNLSVLAQDRARQT